MSIQELVTEQERKEYLMDVFKLLVTELPQEGMKYTETDDYISLRKTECYDDLLNVA